MYVENEISKVFQKLISGNKELTDYFLNEINLENYGLTDDDLPYIDIGVISRYIVNKKIKNETSQFEIFFKNVEEIYCNSDDWVKEFIVIGLFEGIQNIGGDEIDYYFSFNQWLGKETQKAWNELIDGWEGTKWRISKEKQKEIDKLLKKN